jgi:hypothetical protein
MNISLVERNAFKKRLDAAKKLAGVDAYRTG